MASHPASPASASGDSPLLDEADCIARYLVGAPATPRERELYAEAHRHLAMDLGPRDAALLRAALAGPFKAGLVDAGLALAEPQSLVRKKFFVMLAILEASPAHCDAFFSKSFGPAGIAAIPLRAALAALRSLSGLVYIRLFFAQKPAAD